ncbi:MAG: CpaF family protein [Phototrophicaceae bacterium]|jgi:pilus assembly protein CpaF
MSFLSNRLQNERDKKPKSTRPDGGDGNLDSDLDALLGDSKAAAAPAPAKPKPPAPSPLAKKPGAKEPVSLAGNVQDSLTPLIPLTDEAALDTGYVPPPKRRLPAHLIKLRKQLRPKLLATLDEADTWKRGELDKEAIIEKRLQTVLDKMSVALNETEYQILKETLLNDLMGFAAIEPLIRDRRYSEIMVNGGDVVFSEFKGKLGETEIVFDDEDHVLWMAQRIVRPLMRTLNRENPMVDARLPDGSRVHIVSAPSALNGTTVTIRKFPEKRLNDEDLIKFGSLTPTVRDFMRACVVARLNIIISGGTGSGKTTLLNVMSGFIPQDERILTIEDAAELNLAQRHVVRLETAPPIPKSLGGDDHKGKLEIRDLVKGSLRMRPDRLVIGECRGGETLDMLQAMNTGHDGSLTTVHSNSTRDAIARLETLVMMAGMDLPIFVIRSQIASAIHLIVQQSRLKDGSRKICQVTELQGMEGEQVTMQDIFVYKTEGFTGQGYSHEGGGRLQATGFRPKFGSQLKEYGFDLPANVFTPGAQL